MLPVIPAGPTTVPDPPAGIGEYARALWYGFWTQPTCGVVDLRRDMGRLHHWAWCVDQRETARRAIDGTPDARDLQFLRYLSREIEAAEIAFGMTPLHKMRLTGALDQADAAEASIAKRAAASPTRKPTRIA